MKCTQLSLKWWNTSPKIEGIKFRFNSGFYNSLPKIIVFRNRLDIFKYRRGSWRIPLRVVFNCRQETSNLRVCDHRRGVGCFGVLRPERPRRVLRSHSFVYSCRTRRVLFLHSRKVLDSHVVSCFDPKSSNFFCKGCPSGTFPSSVVPIWRSPSLTTLKRSPVVLLETDLVSFYVTPPESPLETSQTYSRGTLSVTNLRKGCLS